MAPQKAFMVPDNGSTAMRPHPAGYCASANCVANPTRRVMNMKKTRTPMRNPPRGDNRRLLRITGLPAVSALFAAAPERVEKLFFDRNTRVQAGAFCSQLARSRKPYHLVEAAELERVAGTMLHGGIVALAQPRPVLDFEPTEAARWAHEHRLLLLLDGIGNPHNFGAIVRTAAFLGAPRIVLSEHPAQAMPSDASYRIAEGGMEHVELYRGRHFVQALKTLRQSHRLVGTAAEGGKPVGSLNRSERPFALILGNEEDGIPPETLRACDDIVTIPGSGAVQSLNVAATAAILIYALNTLSLRQGSE
ncbi:MAG TPA: RNA methyltransferase [Gammaproteobacteria bacterium]|nr:RNA methyltransferase [Gammaproteobacteria bacterium]